MALTDENGGGIPATMLVAPTGTVGGGMPYPVYMNGQGGGSNGGWDNGNGWWIILLFILLASGNWGGQNSNGWGGGQPIIVNDGGSGSSVQRGFDQAAVMGGLSGIQSGVQGLSTQLCNCCCDMQNTVNQGFFGVQNALCNGFNSAEVAANSRQMANMQQAFAAQTASTQGFTGVNSGIADLRYTVATEACADRAAVSDALKDVIAANTASTQRILDQLCADKIEAKNDEIAQLRQQVNMQALAASQAAQNAFIQQGFSNEVDALYNRLNSCPVPTTPVYGRTPIFTCNNNGCGCGCGNNF